MKIFKAGHKYNILPWAGAGRHQHRAAIWRWSTLGCCPTSASAECCLVPGSWYFLLLTQCQCRPWAIRVTSGSNSLLMGAEGTGQQDIMVPCVYIIQAVYCLMALDLCVSLKWKLCLSLGQVRFMIRTSRIYLLEREHRTPSQARGGGEAADCGSALRWSELGPMRFVQLIWHWIWTFKLSFELGRVKHQALETM